MFFDKFQLKKFIKNSNVFGWKNLKVAKKLKNGWTNKSFYVELKNNKKFLVRITKKNLHIDRKNEYKAINLLKANIIFFDQKNGNFIREWIDGSFINSWKDDYLKLFARKLKSFHENKSFNELIKFDHYQFIKKANIEKSIIELYKKILEKYSQETKTICHNDLHRWNIILDRSNNLQFIDLELVQMNYPLWDLANFVREENLDAYQIGLLINNYNSKINMKDFYNFLFLTACLGWQWTFSLTTSLKILKRRRQMKNYTKWVIKNFIEIDF